MVAMEIANDGITCNAICPGCVLDAAGAAADRSPRQGQRTIDPAGEADLVSEKQPMHAFTTPEQVASLMLFLCNDAAATITGSACSIDGGWTAQ